MTLDNGKSDHILKNGNLVKQHGLGWFVTGLFIIGDVAGGGVIAIPIAIIRLGFTLGVLGVLLVAIFTAYTAYVLGESWIILQKRWPNEYAVGHCRKPYPEITQRALGPLSRHISSFCINSTQFGIAVVYLLISSKNIQDFLIAIFDINISFCFIIIIVTLGLAPITFLKSPKDFWAVVVAGMISTAFSVILIIVGIIFDFTTCAPNAEFIDLSLKNSFLAVGTIVFSFGGHAVFPTIQHDMLKPHQFRYSVLFAFSLITLGYLSIAVLGYFTYGDALRQSIINSIQSIWIQQFVNLLITIHCILTLTIVFNPINQELEEFFNIPHHFCIQRILVRSITLFCVVFMAESVPTFGPLLDFFGGSTMTITSVVFPPLCYLFLKCGMIKMEERRQQLKQKNTSVSSLESIEIDRVTIKDVFQKSNKFTLVLCITIIVLGIAGGFAASYAALKAIGYTNFVPPCYVTPFLGNTDQLHVTQSTVCCGHNQNLNRFWTPGQNISAFCAKPDFTILS